VDYCPWLRLFYLCSGLWRYWRRENRLYPITHLISVNSRLDDGGINLDEDLGVTSGSRTNSPDLTLCGYNLPSSGRSRVGGQICK